MMLHTPKLWLFCGGCRVIVLFCGLGIGWIVFGIAILWLRKANRLVCSQSGPLYKFELFFKIKSTNNSKNLPFFTPLNYPSFELWSFFLPVRTLLLYSPFVFSPQTCMVRYSFSMYCRLIYFFLECCWPISTSALGSAMTVFWN